MSGSLLELGRFEAGTPINAQGRVVAPGAGATIAVAAVTPGLYHLKGTAVVDGGTPADTDIANMSITNTGDADLFAVIPNTTDGTPAPYENLVQVNTAGNIEIKALNAAGTGVVYATSFCLTKVR